MREVTCKVFLVPEKMTDWGPVFVAVTLFIVLSPGLLFQIPAKSRFVEFGNHQTSGPSILVHSIIYFVLICISLMAIRVKIHLGLGSDHNTINTKGFSTIAETNTEDVRLGSDFRSGGAVHTANTGAADSDSGKVTGH
ncbi:hypothetical protein V6N13_044235 [Hibiscus sabdariffa]|uniref:Uncharacterized protein n=1 Tax=Hibiscus sabdariffa TaxID=183260 RepID=A0ABR2RHK2_9ROSI